MTLPSSPNPISADQIRTEFGPSGISNSVSLGNYRISQTVSGLSNLPLDTGIPQSGAINFGSFRGKKLNIVVDCTPYFTTTLTITDNLGVSVTVDFNNLATYSTFTTEKIYTIIPNNTITTNIYAVGGGGGTAIGGSGGASQGRFTFVFGRTYKLIVGGGANGATAGYGGGGATAGGQSGGGGGYTGLFLDSISQTNAILIAGGGGGGSTVSGGSGGGLTGGNGSSLANLFNRGGTGGTQTSGGTGGSTGSALQGANSASISGAGGGGYFGGGGGQSRAGGGGAGGGGSGYINSTLISNGSFAATNSAGGGGPQNNGSFKIDFVSSSIAPSPDLAPRINAKSRYDANTNVSVIGNFKPKPDTVTNQKVWIHINGTAAVSSPAPSRTYCTFLTGSWDATTDLYIDIGPSGSIMGAGGASGSPGSSAIGIIATNNVVVTNRGTILPGGGGGGQGGQGADGAVTVGRTGNTQIGTIGGPGGAGGLGQGYNQINTAGAPGGASPSLGGAVRVGASGGRGGTGGTWGNVGAGGSKGADGTISQVNAPTLRSTGRPGLPGGSGGCDYVVSNDGTGVSGLSLNVALNIIPT